VTRGQKAFGLLAPEQIDEIERQGQLVPLAGNVPLAEALGPDASEPGTLTDPREFNLMFDDADRRHGRR